MAPPRRAPGASGGRKSRRRKRARTAAKNTAAQAARPKKTLPKLLADARAMIQVPGSGMFIVKIVTPGQRTSKVLNPDDPGQAPWMEQTAKLQSGVLRLATERKKRLRTGLNESQKSAVRRRDTARPWRRPAPKVLPAASGVTCNPKW